MNILMYLNVLTILLCFTWPNVSAIFSATKSKGDTDVPSDKTGTLHFSDCEIISGPEGKPFKYNIEKGEKGDKGPKGDDLRFIGPPGISGMNGKCIGGKDTTEGKIVKDPLEAPCKFYNITKSDYYNLRVKERNIKVFCNKDTLETCIYGGKSDPKSFEHATSPFWLTEIGIDLKNLYGLTVVDILWLQERSSYARQVLKYGCVHSVPYSRIHLNKSVELLTWNDLVVGPFPSPSTPLFYSVSPKTDFCAKYSDKNKGALIEIRSTNTNRLPIIDIRINSVNDTDRTVSIENHELCFG